MHITQQSCTGGLRHAVFKQPSKQRLLAKKILHHVSENSATVQDASSFSTENTSD
jgi:hypothetical protein